MTTFEPELAYSSNQDGFSLTTFYNKSELYEPTILVIKTTKKEIFGAYCSTSWCQRGMKDDRGARQLYFGGGESFLFSFSEHLTNGQGPVRYPWVLGANAPKDKQVDQSQLTKAELHSYQLFMTGQHDMISIGGG